MPISSPVPIESSPIHLELRVCGRLRRRLRRQSVPHIHDTCPASGQHAILETVEVLAVNGRHEIPSCKTHKDMR